MSNNPNTQKAAAAASRAVEYVTEVVAGEDLYRSVRAGLMLQGYTFNSYCNAKGIGRQWARLCLTGKCNGPKAREMRRRFVRAAGL